MLKIKFCDIYDESKQQIHTNHIEKVTNNNNTALIISIVMRS